MYSLRQNLNSVPIDSKADENVNDVGI